MTQRERKMVLVAGGVGAVVVGLIAFNSLFLEPLHKSDRERLDLDRKIDDKWTELRQKEADKRELARLKAISLPADPDPLHQAYDRAWNEYDKYLRELMRSSGLKSVRVSGMPPSQGAPGAARNAKPVYIPLTYTVAATGPASSVVAMLEQFYKTPILHQITKLNIKPIKVEQGPRTGGFAFPAGGGAFPVGGGAFPAGGGAFPAGGGGFPPVAAPTDERLKRNVDIMLTVEALLVDGAEKRANLMPVNIRLLAINAVTAMRRGPAGLPFVPWNVDLIKGYGVLHPRPLIEATMPGFYSPIAQKNIFFGPVAPKDPSQKRKPPTIESSKFLFLTDIIRRSDGKVQASLFDRLRGGRSIRLDSSDKSYGSIPVCRDTENERLLRGEVVHICRTQVVFRVRLASRMLGREDNGERIVCLSESEQTYRMAKTYWDALEEEETLITTFGSGVDSSFKFRGGVMAGRVTREDEDYVEFTLYSKYLDRLYAIHVDESLDSALQEPLTSSEIKDLEKKEGLLVKNTKK
jgi:hypothetical protein